MLHLKWSMLIFGCILLLNACKYNKGEDLGPIGSPVNFQTEIKPIIINNCVTCHSDTATNPSKPGYAFFLQVKGGSADFSVLQQYAIARSTANPAYTKLSARLRGIESPAMPFQRPPLPDSLIKKIENWSRQGAPLN
jgi:hypothetical protein